ncbi:MAG: hypothetical protein NTX52_11175 [Planctomycetota bacterium]|nr:hypothetical protein [Planctomycetota bacterium]
MPRPKTAKSADKPVSLLILEGYTEDVFYPLIRDKFLKGIRIELRNIKGRGNVNKDIISEIYKYTYNNPDKVRAYGCVDTERHKQSATPFDLDSIREKAKERNMTQVLSIHQILADPDIESWFFYDIEGICEFIRAKSSQQNTKKYSNPSRLSKKNLQELFHKFGKEYLPGGRAQHFINSLDIEKIVSCCKVLGDGIELIRSQAENLMSHLFPLRNHGSG